MTKSDLVLLPLLTAALPLLAGCSASPGPPVASQPTSTPRLAPTATPSPTRTPAPTPTIQSAGALTLGPGNAQIFRYPSDTFVRPLALSVAHEMAYLLDGGRLLAVRLSDGALSLVPFPAEGIDRGGASQGSQRSGRGGGWQPDPLGSVRGCVPLGTGHRGMELGADRHLRCRFAPSVSGIRCHVGGGLLPPRHQPGSGVASRRRPGLRRSKRRRAARGRRLRCGRRVLCDPRRRGIGRRGEATVGRGGGRCLLGPGLG